MVVSFKVWMRVVFIVICTFLNIFCFCLCETGPTIALVLFFLLQIEQNRALHDGLIYILALPLVAVFFFIYDSFKTIFQQRKKPYS
jgi:hypothetical protein